MNPTFSTRVIRIFRLDFCRCLSIQSNINKNNNTSNGTSNFQRKIQNCSTSFPLFRQSFQKSLCNAPLPLCTNFHRNFMKESKDPLGDLDKPIVEPDIEVQTPQTLQEAVEEIAASAAEIFDTLSDSTLVEYAERLFIEMHDITGLPWWASIALTAAFVRTTIVSPFSIMQLQVVGKLQMVSFHMQKVMKRLKKESAQARIRYGWPKEIIEKKYKDAINDEWKLLIQKENCHPIKCFYLIGIQVPTWAIFSLALRKLCLPPEEGVVASKVYTELSTGGFGWITDLTVVDSTCALPVTLGIVYILIIEVHRLFRIEPHVSAEELKCLIMQLLNITVVGLSTFSSSALSIYWISSGLYGLIQAFLLNTQLSYRLLNIPVLGSPIEHPYSLFKKNLKNRFKKKEKLSFYTIEK